MTRAARQSPSGRVNSALAVASAEAGQTLSGTTTVAFPVAETVIGPVTIDQNVSTAFGAGTVFRAGRTGFWQAAVLLTYSGLITTGLLSVIPEGPAPTARASGESTINPTFSAGGPAFLLEAGEGVFVVALMGAARDVASARASLGLVGLA